MADTHVDIGQRADVDKLKGEAIGLTSVLFLCITGSAPLAVTLFNTPYVMPLGSGWGGPGAFALATIVLTVFSVAYVQMALKVRAAGGMYSFVSHGLGRPLGMMSGFSLLVAYGLFGASLIGGFAQFTGDNFRNYLDLNIPWIWFALFAVVIVVLLGYYDVNISAKILGVALITEVAIIAIFSAVVFIHGGKSGVSISPILPWNGFAQGVAPGIGIFFAFWSWVGFEAAPNYAEESKDPVRTIPIAVYFSCIAVGVLYTIMSWALVTAYGSGDAITAAFTAGTSEAATPVTINGHTFVPGFTTVVTGPFQAYSSKFLADVMNWLIVTGSVACASALTNAGLRYWYAMGREGILPRALGRTHPTHKSPHIAIFTQGAISAALCLIFWFANRGPLDMYGWLAVQGVIWIVLVQALTALSTFFYFRRNYRSEMHWFKHVTAPWLGFAAQIVVLALLYHNLYYLAVGTAYVNPLFEIGSGTWSLDFSWLGVIGVLVPVAGLAYAYFVRATNPAKYDVMGRFVNETTTA